MTNESLENLRVSLSVKSKNGIDFTLSAGIIWIIIAWIWTLDYKSYDRSVFTFIIGALMIPLALLFSKVLKTTWTDKDNPLQPLGLWMNFSQLFYFPFLVFSLIKFPDYFIMVYAIITGGHFFLFAWFYKTNLYAIFAGIISIGAMTLGLILPVERMFFIAILMSVSLILLTILLFFDSKKKKPLKLSLVLLGLLLVRNACPQNGQVPTAPTGIEIVAQLEKPKNNLKFNEKDLAGYLLVYFKDQNQSAYMAISSDGYTFTDVNGGNPVFIGAQLAEQKGVRDPHITRGPNGAFYLAMTDLHIFGKRAGFRDTEFERPAEKYGWGNNRALVLMKSYDLIHWTHSDFRVDKAFPELGDIDCSWAPETVFDPAVGKMMIYFTIRYNNKDCNLYYSYTDDNFTKLETTPKRITDIVGLDGDITKVGNQYQLYYVSNARILHSVSGKINEGFKTDTTRIDPEKVSTEAPNLFKRLGTNTYVLMYDVYGARPSNMGFSETTDFVSYKNIGHFNEGPMKSTNFKSPKHGAVTYLTKRELKAIAEHWKMDFK